MDSMEKEVKKRLKAHLRGTQPATIDSVARKLGPLPYERVLLITDIAIALAATNLRASVEMLKAAPEVSRLVDASDMRVWGEIGKRLSATSAESGASFFQASASVIAAIDEE